MNGNLRRMLICLVATLAVAFTLTAQQEGGSSSQATRTNNKMMQTCHENMQKMRTENSQTRRQIAEAKASNDPAKMRAALDQAEKSLNSIDSHMTMCNSMMGNMKGMHGMMSDQDKTPTTEKPNEPPK
jgi:phage shock protein A